MMLIPQPCTMDSLNLIVFLHDGNRLSSDAKQWSSSELQIYGFGVKVTVDDFFLLLYCIFRSHKP